MKPEKREQQLPSDWTDTTFGNVAEYITSGSRDWSKYYSDHGSMFIRTQDINTNRLRLDDVARVALPEKVEGKRTRVFKDDILITITGANVGKVALVDHDIGEAYVSQSVALVRLGDKQLGKFLHYQLMTKVHGDKTHLESMAYGLGRPVLNLDNIRDVPIRLAPLDQQNRIVAEIEKQFSRLDEAVANLKRVKANLKRYKAAVLKAAVEGKLTEEWRKAHPDVEPARELLKRILAVRRAKWNGKGKYKEPEIPSLSEFQNLPAGWTFARIEQLLPPRKEAMKTGPFGSLLKKHEHRAEGIPVFGIENIEAMHFVPGSKIHVTAEKAKELNEYRVEPRDILISRSGTVGEVCVVPEDIGAAIFSTNLMKISLGQNGMNPQFFTFLFNGSPFVLNQVADLCKGSTRNFLNQDILKTLVFILPPLEEQEEIVREVDRHFSLVKESEKEIDNTLRRAQRLKQSILNRAFSGKLMARHNLPNGMQAEV